MRLGISSEASLTDYSHELLKLISSKKNKKKQIYFEVECKTVVTQTYF